MNGRDQAKEMAEKVRQEQAEKEEKELEVKKQVQSELATVAASPSLAKMYQDNARVGSANLSNELPLLKVHAAGRSTSNRLATGGEPHDGWFFYKPTREEFETITCHILTISRGFTAPDQNKNDKFNQIMGGVIIDGSEMKPFIMYFTGTKLQNLWNFGKEASTYTKARPVGIPMFALKVHMSTEKVKTNFGQSSVVKFEIVRNDDGSPKLVLDEGIFQFLKDNVEMVEETISNLIATKTSSDATDKDAIQGETVEDEPTSNEVSLEDIPF